MLQRSIIGLNTIRLLAVGVLCLAVVNIFLNLARSERTLWFNYLFLGFDNNIPAWYSSFLLAISALLAFECRDTLGQTETRDRRIFLGLGLLLILMSCDEIAKFHEILPEVIANKIGLKK